jgi:hypothetical protein
MTRKRILTDDQCRDLAQWAQDRNAKLSELSIMAKCREMGISHSAYLDALARATGEDPEHMRRKLEDMEESTNESAIAVAS